MSTVSQELGKISRSFKDISLNFGLNPVTKDIVVLKMKRQLNSLSKI